ncbi:MAG: hypothetical protein IPO21_05015 [Bacteroidales bacterium]|nr:hypothetical protein [Bacteroidales bacterium]
MKPQIHTKSALTLFFSFLLSFLLHAQITIEAENYSSVVNGNSEIVLENSGASIGYFDEKDEMLHYSVNITESGYYEMGLRSLAGVNNTVECITSTNASGYIFISAASAGDWWLTPIGNWTTSSFTSSPLFFFESGQQSFTLRNTGTGVNIDKIVLSKSTITNTTISSIIVNPEKVELMPNKSVQITAYGVNTDNKTIAAPIT